LGLTTQVATDTIDYVVTDQSGLTSTSTRTLIIQAAHASIRSAWIVFVGGAA
jgi:hypothetical protein